MFGDQRMVLVRVIDWVEELERWEELPLAF